MTEPTAAVDAPEAAPPRRRPWRVVVVVALAAALTAGGFFVLTRPRGPDVALALGFEEGATYRYRVTLSIDGRVDTALADLPIDGELAETVSYRVVEVDPDGAATIDVGVEDLSGTFAGRPVPPTPETEIRMVIGADGSIREVDGRPVPQALQAGLGDPAATGGIPGMQSFPLLPDGPVGPGDEWEKDVEQPLPFGEGQIRIHSESELVRYEDVGPVRAALIESDITSAVDWTVELAELAELGRELEGTNGGFAEVEGLPDRISYRGELEQEQTTWLAPGEMVRSELTSRFDLTTRAEGSEGLGALVGAIPVRMVGEMRVAMERLEP